MRIRNWMVSKIMGFETPKVMCDRKAQEMLKRNGLTNVLHSQYRLDKSLSNPNFYCNVYIGIADRGSSKVGFVISVDEDCGLVSGYLIDEVLATWHARLARGYKLNPSYFQSFVSYVLSESSLKESLEESPSVSPRAAKESFSPSTKQRTESEQSHRNTPRTETRSDADTLWASLDAALENAERKAEAKKPEEASAESLETRAPRTEYSTHDLRAYKWQDRNGIALSADMLPRLQAEFIRYRLNHGELGPIDWMQEFHNIVSV